MSVLVINFGSQFSALIVKKIRDSKVYSEIIPWHSEDLIETASQYEALILSGSPDSVQDEKHDDIALKLLKLKKPMLGICYGMQLIHKVLGGELSYGTHAEFGTTENKKTMDSLLLDGVPIHFKTIMSHHDSVIKLAPGFVGVSKSEKIFSAAVNDKRRIYTLQFHPEVDNFECGNQIINNFLFLICRFTKEWKFENIAQNKIKELRRRIGKEKVLLALSGGVDSTIVAQLIYRACPNIVMVFVDNGLLRETDWMNINYLKSEFNEHLIIVKAEDRFMNALKGITEPEDKRRIVGELFAEIFKEFIEKEGNTRFLAQGTIHSDLIESGKKTSHTIKTHHNTVDVLKETFELIEPLSDLFKNEVKLLGKEIGVPEFILNTQPFPGPGYAIRILGEVTKDKVRILKQVDSLFLKKIKESGLNKHISQSFSVLLDSKSVGVMGDRRHYGYVIALRAINSKNFMTADVSDIPMEILKELSNEIINTVSEVTRVVFDLTSKPPATIEWE